MHKYGSLNFLFDGLFGITDILAQIRSKRLFSARKGGRFFYHGEYFTLVVAFILVQFLEVNIALANELLGYHYFLAGTVIHGDKMGRQLGYPTANLQLPDERKLIPSEGIYAVKVNTTLNAVMSIGTRPTFNGTDLRLEVHLFDFNREIYGELLQVEFIDFIRHSQKFDSVEALIAQMNRDSEKARAILSA